MKKFIILCDLSLVVLMFLSVSIVKPVEVTTVIQRQTMYVNSEVIQKEIVEEVTVAEEIISPPIDKQESTVNFSEKEVAKVEKQEEILSKPELLITEDHDIFIGKMSGYGADIGAYTASGYSIQDTITYQDKEYGTLRILAAGNEYPFGTIVKVSDSMEGEFLGVVLDRGGDIGRGEGKKFTFDLLYQTSQEAYQKGVCNKVQFEIMRIGW